MLMLAWQAFRCYKYCMKLFLALLLIVGGYYVAMLGMSNLAMQQVNGVQKHYQAVAAYTDQLEQGNPSATLNTTFKN